MPVPRISVLAPASFSARSTAGVPLDGVDLVGELDRGEDGVALADVGVVGEQALAQQVADLLEVLADEPEGARADRALLGDVVAHHRDARLLGRADVLGVLVRVVEDDGQRRRLVGDRAADQVVVLRLVARAGLEVEVQVEQLGGVLGALGDGRPERVARILREQEGDLAVLRLAAETRRERGALGRGGRGVAGAPGTADGEQGQRGDDGDPAGSSGE